MNEMLLATENKTLTEMKMNDYLHKNTIYLDTEIDRESQVLFCRQLEKLAQDELAKRDEDRKPIKIKITSYGGSLVSVFAMISYMEHWQSKGIVIETVCDGFTASGGTKILMAGTKGHRYITKYANVLLHQIQTGQYGSITHSELITKVEDLDRSWEILKIIFKKNTKLTDEEIDRYIDCNKDVVYSSEEAIEKGIVDKII